MKVGYGWILLFSAARAFWIPPTRHTSPHRLISLISGSVSGTSVFANNAGVYVHIPFCRRRCRYCDFAIVPVGSEDRTGFAHLNDQYTTALLHEITHHPSANLNHTITSIYFGGGTPSLAPISTLRAIFEKLYEQFHVAPDCEITIEMDPGTFDFAKATALRDMGFNRISLGVQSFNDTILESLGRIHRKIDVMNALQILQKVWGDDLNYSMDLISGLPGLSVAEWVNTLENVIHLQPRPNHLSLYDLQVEPVSAFNDK
jgi:oxygen-independent coproporphyrinogen-3 oxidase